MKHLLILISFLLLSSPVIGHPKGEHTLYRWETNSGMVWKGFGEKDTHPKYKGEVTSGKKPNGVGTLIYLNGDKYIGEFDDGRKDGLGTYTWSNHENMEKYVGEFTNGEFGKKGKIYYKSGQIYEGNIYDDYSYGKGVMTLTDGSKYEGVWSRRKDDKISKWEIKGYDKDGEIILDIQEGIGKGTYTWSNGDMYVGEFKDGKRNGKGAYTFGKGDFEGNRYVGEYKDGEYHGQGTYTWPDGSMFLGEFKDDKPNGQGTYSRSDGMKYEGEWKDAKFHGQGTETLADGGKKVGEWRDNKEWNIKYANHDGTLLGKFEDGILVWGMMFRSLRGGLSYKWYFEGDKKKDWYYLGDIKNGLPHGDGTQILPSGIKYVGKFKDGLRHGQGEENHPDIGIKYVGEFKNGFHMWNTIKYKNGNAIGKYIDGEYTEY
jgi:hypothetical protein